MKRLIVTADDFGRCLPVNEAVEEAHARGILTAASLMVGGDAVEDAVVRARRLSGLAVGLHVTLVDGRPLLAPDRIPALVDGDGRFSARLVGLGIRIGCKRTVRAQVADEVRAQFERFRSFGLRFDHVDSHHHYHLHPFVAAIVVALARDYGVPALRVPWEPPFAVRHRVGLARVLAAALIHAPLSRSMRRRAAEAGLLTNDRVFGLYDTGALDSERLRRLIAALPDGISELYCHPATRPWDDQPRPKADRCRDEFRALVDPAVIDAVHRSGATLSTYGGLAQRG